MVRAIPVIAILAAGCGSYYYPTGSYDPGPPSTVWLVTAISGGRQCSPYVRFEPPNLVEELRAAGIRVYDHSERGRAVCRACSCSSYSAHHYVKVAAQDQDVVKRLGFELSSPPPRDG